MFGVTNLYRGYDAKCIFSEGRCANYNLRNLIIHLLACHTAERFGPDLIQNYDCSAFFGYDDAFAYPKDPTNRSEVYRFFECDATVDLALAEGKTADAAFLRAHQTFHDNIDTLQNDGFYYAEACMDRIRDYFRGPTWSYGNPRAKLTPLVRLQPERPEARP